MNSPDDLMATMEHGLRESLVTALRFAARAEEEARRVGHTERAHLHAQERAGLEALLAAGVEVAIEHGLEVLP